MHPLCLKYKILIMTLTTVGGVKERARTPSMTGVDVRSNVASSNNSNSRPGVACRPRVFGLSPGGQTLVKIISPV